MKIISLFSGAGGLDLGLIQAGHEVVWANDNDPDAVASYKLNIGNHIVLADIAEIDTNAIPEGDVVVGGFPCQGFSLANRQRHGEDERNALYLQFLRILRAKKTKYFLAENVRGILSLEKGAAIKKIVADFAELGYRVQVKLFNTADYGVPQTRQRVIIAGTRQDIPESQNYVYPSPTHSKTGENRLFGKVKPWVSIQDALQVIPEPNGDEPDLPNHIYSKYKVTDRNFTGHRKTDPNKPSPTILARGNGKGGVCAIQHPDNHRRMSVRESALIQTFPLDFKFIGTMGSCYRQVGNAVPILFARHLGIQLKKIEEKEVECV